MKLLIEISEDSYKATCNESMLPPDVRNVVDAIKNVTPIPENATNGDMIMAMFPYAIKSNYIESGVDMKDYVTVYLGDYEMRVSFDWWDAPYRKEAEE